MKYWIIYEAWRWIKVHIITVQEQNTGLLAIMLTCSAHRTPDLCVHLGVGMCVFVRSNAVSWLLGLWLMTCPVDGHTDGHTDGWLLTYKRHPHNIQWSTVMSLIYTSLSLVCLRGVAHWSVSGVSLTGLSQGCRSMDCQGCRSLISKIRQTTCQILEKIIFMRRNVKCEITNCVRVRFHEVVFWVAVPYRLGV